MFKLPKFKITRDIAERVALDVALLAFSLWVSHRKGQLKAAKKLAQDVADTFVN